MDAPDSLWLSFLGAETRFRDAGGYRTRSIEAGDGEAVVLLHGILGHAEAWRLNLLPLAQEYRVHAIDVLGHGLTDKPDIDYSVRAIGDHVIAFLDSIGVRRAHIVGHSMSGWVGGWLAMNRPDRIASYVNVVGSGFRLTDEPLEVAPRPRSPVVQMTYDQVSNPTREGIRTMMGFLLQDPSSVPAEAAELRYRMFTQPGFSTTAPGIIDNLLQQPQVDDLLTPTNLGKISCPSLVLWTSLNPAPPPDVAEAASKLIPDGRYYLMDDVGHSPQSERPDEFNAVVLDFLRSVPGRADRMVVS